MLNALIPYNCSADIALNLTGNDRGISFNVVGNESWSRSLLSRSVQIGRVVMMTSSNGNIFRVTGPLCGEFPTKRPVTRSFDVFFDLRLIKRLSKPRGWWFETLSRPLWRHCHGYWITFQETLSFLQVSFLTTKVVLYNCQADSRLAPSQWETSLQNNTVPHWLVANLESALNWYRCGMWRFKLNSWSPTQHGGGHGHLLLVPVTPIWTTHCIYLSWVVISNRKETNCLPLADDVARIRSRVQEPCLE